MAVQFCSVDQKIWRACAGSTVHVPPVHSRVYYFPQGHLEQASSGPSHLSPLVLDKPFVLCRVVSVQFMADPCDEEVFSRMILHPISDSPGFPFRSSEPRETRLDIDANFENEDKIISHVKILTPSDANNGGGFSVPRFCADSVFPPLDLKADPPVQTLSITDIHGTVWLFRHIYRGTPRRHLLTTGWSKFVNQKKLVAGDSVVFMKNSRGEMFVGIRRGLRPSYNVDYSRYGGKVGKTDGDDCDLGVVGFRRSEMGKVSAEDVTEAAETAAKGLPFEVSYYPRAGRSDFVVNVDLVEKAMSVGWTPGFRVKIAIETEDSSRITWFQGTVSSVHCFQNECWRGSPWRMLEVKWDEPDVLQNAKRQNPWRVEVVRSSPPLHFPPFPPLKKSRFIRNSEIVLAEPKEPFFSEDGLINNSTRGRNSQLLNHDTFPAGMQGARQNLQCGPNFSKACNENSLQMNMDTAIPKLRYVSTQLNIGTSQSDDLSPVSQTSVLSFGSDLNGNRSCNSTKLGHSSFQLFGKIIHLKPPEESDFDDGGCSEDDESKRSHERLHDPTNTFHKQS